MARELGRDPAGAHGALGNQLFRGLTRLHDPSAETEGALVAAWNDTPPVGLLRPYSASLLPRHLGKSDLLPRTIATLGRAQRRIRIAVMQCGAPAGHYEGRDAVRITREHLLPALHEPSIRSWINGRPGRCTRPLEL